jgi:hypothetical protein
MVLLVIAFGVAFASSYSNPALSFQQGIPNMTRPVLNLSISDNFAVLAESWYDGQQPYNALIYFGQSPNCAQDTTLFNETDGIRYPPSPGGYNTRQQYQSWAWIENVHNANISQYFGYYCASVTDSLGSTVSNSTALLFGSDSIPPPPPKAKNFTAPVITLSYHLSHAFLWAKWNSTSFMYFTATLYGGNSPICAQDTTFVMSQFGAPDYPPSPGSTQTNTPSQSVFHLLANTIDQFPAPAYFCAYVNDSYSDTLNSTAVLVNASLIPTSTTSSSTTSTTSSYTTTLPNSTTSIRSTSSSATTSSTTSSSSTSSSTSTVGQVSCGCVCSGTCVHHVNSTSPTTTSAVKTTTSLSTTIYYSTTTINQTPSQSIIRIITAASYSPEQPTLKGSIENIISIFRSIFRLR